MLFVLNAGWVLIFEKEMREQVTKGVWMDERNGFLCGRERGKDRQANESRGPVEKLPVLT